jgi:hypothetical protein
VASGEIVEAAVVPELSVSERPVELDDKSQSVEARMYLSDRDT